jgi:hypothetical protein
MSNIDLSTCQVGQKVELDNGAIAEYEQWDEDDDLFTHLIDSRWYKNNGFYYSDERKSAYNVVKILPLEPAKSNKHPSVAAWESFPWITDRPPTAEDTTQQGWLPTMVLTLDSVGLRFCHCSEVAPGLKWIHLPSWAPPRLTPQEEALALLEGKKDGWVPTLDDWHIIRRAICS